MRVKWFKFYEFVKKVVLDWWNGVVIDTTEIKDAMNETIIKQVNQRPQICEIVKEFRWKRREMICTHPHCKVIEQQKEKQDCKNV